MERDQRLGLYDGWDNTLVDLQTDGLEDEPFEVDVISTDEKEPEIRTVYVEKPIEVVKEVIKEVPVEVVKEVIKEVQVPVEVIKEVPVTGIMDTVNQSSSTVGNTNQRGPLYAYRTNKGANDDKNLAQSTD